MRKIIATGKGGVGKTTSLSALCQIMSSEGKRVIVFDTDPSMNFALGFGVPFDKVSTITEDTAEISGHLEDEGIEVSGEEILRDHSVLTEDGIRIVIMGAIMSGGDGCLCSAISLIKILLNYAEGTGDYDVAIVDSQAGPEVLGRGLASEFDINMILTEPTAKSSEVSRQVMKLGKDLGVKNTLLVVNKVIDEDDLTSTAELVGVDADSTIGIRFDKSVIKADREGKLLLDAFPESDAAMDIKALAVKVKSLI